MVKTSDEHTTSIFRVEGKLSKITSRNRKPQNGGDMFLWNVS
jgi:hypothetical protein